MDDDRWGLLTLVILVRFFDYPVSMIGLTHGVRSNTLPPSAALLVLGIWQCGAMLLLENMANRWLARPAAWLGVVIANSVVLTVYLWNMSAVVLAAVLLFPTGLAPQPEALSPAWWWLRPAWIVACAICLIPFVLAFRWEERPVAPTRPTGGEPTGVRTAAQAGLVDGALAVTGTALAAIGFTILTTQAFPVPGQVVLMPTIGVACVALGALLLRVDPVAPLRAR